MSLDQPYVSLGMPLFNAERFVAQAFDSILAQTFRDFELVISDNGSTDHTEAICREYAARDSRIRYYRNDINRGAAWNHNHVFRLSRGRFFKWAGYDDLLAPTFLEKCLAAFESNPHIVLSFSKFQDFDEYGTRVGVKSCAASRCAEAHRRLRALLRNGHTCEEIYGMMRSEVLKKTPLIGPYTYSDQNLLAELALHGRFSEVPEVLFFHRWHASSTYRLWPNRSDRWLWFDPAAAGRVLFPYWKQLFEFASTIGRSEIGGGERVRCYIHLAEWVVRCRKGLAGDAYWGARALVIRSIKSRLPWVKRAYRGWSISQDRS